jgi:hypothetical protein
MKKRKTPTVFDNLGSLITFQNEQGATECLGSLVHFPFHGVFDPTYGRVDVDPKYVDAHNKAFVAALIEGLSNAKVGQSGTFYAVKNSGDGYTIKTFTGTIVTSSAGKSFTIIGHKYSVRYRRSDSLCTVTRIA